MDYRLLSNNNNNNYPTHHHWFPKMCSCIDGSSTLPGNRPSGRVGSYERLDPDPNDRVDTIFELSSTMQRTRRRNRHRDQDLLDSERQEELRFYNGDHTWTTVVVEKNLRTIDLCELLKVKRNAIGAAWSIIETWPELGIERTLEDHEDILAVHRELEMFASGHERRFYFSEDFLKYELFVNPKQFFPADMVAFPSGEDRGIFSNVETALRNYLSREDGECPQVFSLVWMRHEGSNTWKKTYMLLQGRKLYTSKKATATPPKRPPLQQFECAKALNDVESAEATTRRAERRQSDKPDGQIGGGVDAFDRKKRAAEE
ncbi:PREDICTED: growth factor receptor-bound protein 14-like isoform X2 [Dinoponera quadriceps]|uniref:Growth factor receptor-bound protein 14-like isoform X2 n=1 Tax=Dinoponera quadriceps TaxID=609295 RepID=A0A6P3XRY3_DINQU|nr:PREDICTED: growth factor receptor-bound protein 14-like isoform X2 [Dinoponera quadriceps]